MVYWFGKYSEHGQMIFALLIAESMGSLWMLFAASPLVSREFTVKISFVRILYMSYAKWALDDE